VAGFWQPHNVPAHSLHLQLLQAKVLVEQGKAQLGQLSRHGSTALDEARWGASPALVDYFEAHVGRPAVGGAGCCFVLEVVIICCHQPACSCAWTLSCKVWRGDGGLQTRPGGQVGGPKTACREADQSGISCFQQV
jgi:hypothetical protein